jgi:hypothetical protein
VVVDNDRFTVRAAQLVIGLCFAYIALYFVLMSRTVSVDADGNVAYMSAFRFAPSVRTNGPLSIFAGRACFLNTVFYPMDWLYWNLTDRKRWSQFRMLKEAMPEETILFKGTNPAR